MQQQGEVEKVKARIRALTAKTVAHGCTEAEALSAAEMVGRLLDRYALSMDQVELRATACVQIELPFPGRQRRPIDGCVTAIARFCDCKVWLARRPDMSCYVLFGFPPDTELAAWLFAVIDRAMTHAATAFRAVRPRLRGTELRQATSSFQHGMAARLSDRLAALHAARRSEMAATTGTGTALVVAKHRQVEAAFREQRIRLVSAGGSGRRIDAAAFRQGQQAGDRVALDRPVGRSGQGQLA